MSKSLKNFVTIRQALEMHTARQLRLMFLVQPFEKGHELFGPGDRHGEGRGAQIKSFLGIVVFWARKVQGHWPQAGDKEKQLEALIPRTRDTIDAAMLDKFATPKGIEALSKLVSSCTDYMNSMPCVSLAPLEQAAKLVTDTLGIVGVEGLATTKENAEQWASALDTFADIRQVSAIAQS